MLDLIECIATGANENAAVTPDLPGATCASSARYVGMIVGGDGNDIGHEGLITMEDVHYKVVRSPACQYVVVIAIYV